MANNEWLDSMLNNKISKEAMESQGTDKQDHYDRKVAAHPWIKEVSELDPIAVEAEYREKLKQEAMTLGKTAALDLTADQFQIPTGNAQLVYGIEGNPGEEFEVKRPGTMLPIGKYKVVDSPVIDDAHSGLWGTFSNITVEKVASVKTAALDDVIADGVTPEETINRDYKRDVSSLSDYALAEMLAEARGHAKQETSEMFYELKEKAKKDVADSREKAEKALLDLIPESSMLDWQKAFKAFTKDATPAEPKEKDLFKSEVPEKAHDFQHPTEEKFKLPKDADKAIPGNGREADERTEATKEAGVTQESIVEGTSKEASLKTEAASGKCRECPCTGYEKSSPEQGSKCMCGCSVARHAIEKSEKKAHCGTCSCDSSMEKKKADGPSASDNCPVCDQPGKDLMNDQKEHMACEACGINYAKASLETEAETDAHKLRRLQLELKELNPISDMAAYTALLGEMQPLIDAKEGIKSHASKEQVIKKVAELHKTAEVASPWAVTTDEQGNEVIARVDQPTNLKESEENKTDDLIK